MGRSFFYFRPTDLDEAPLSRGEHQRRSSSLSNNHELGELEKNRRHQRSIERVGLGEVNKGRQRSLNRAGGRVNYNSHYYNQALGEVEDSQRRAEIPMASEGRAEYNSYNQGYFGKGERRIGTRRDLDSGFELNRKRVSYSRVGVDNLPL